MAINGLTPQQPNRKPSATDLPLAGNNLTQGSYSFVFTNSQNVVSELTLVVNPEEFQQVESSTSTVILTAGDVFSDTYGPGLTRIRISGTFGQRPGVASGSGQLEALRLRKFFRTYLDEVNPITTGGASGPARNYGALLQFFNPKDNEFWNIEIPGEYLTITRSKNSPFMYRYNLTFIGMTPSSQNGLYDILTNITNVLDNVGNISQTISDIITDSATYASEISTISTSIGLGAVYFPNQILTPLSNLGDAVANFLNGTTKVINYPLAGVDQLIANSQYMLSTFSNFYINQIQTNSGSFTYDPNVDNLLTSAVQSCAALKLYSNSFVKNYINSDFSTQTSLYDSALDYVDLAQVKSVVYGKVCQGDTIESLALNGMGSVSLWKSLAQFNNLAYPYIYIVDPNNPLDFQPEKTLGLGMNIGFPQFISSPKSALVLGASTGGPDTAEFAFGTDFQLDATGDIVFEPAIGGFPLNSSDIQTVTGIKNLIQAIQIKFDTAQGELITHLNYGLPNLLGYRTLSFISALAASAVKSAALSDPRIEDVTNIQVTIQDDVINYICEIIPKYNSTPIVLEGTIGGNVDIQS